MKSKFLTLYCWACLFGSIALLGLVVAGCSTTAVKQDKPFSPEQCFESKFNIFRVSPEKWTMEKRMGNVVFLKNPNKGKNPQFVAIIIHPMGTILKYCYLEGKDVVFYKLEPKTPGASEGCYRADAVPEDVKTLMKKLLMEVSGLKEANVPEADLSLWG